MWDSLVHFICLSLLWLIPALKYQQCTWNTDEHQNLYVFHLFNSLWPSDAIWQQGSRSTLAHVMACCLTAPSHYLNQCWLIISEVLWHSSESNFTDDISAINHCNWLEKYSSKISLKSHWPQWVNHCHAELCLENMKLYLHFVSLLNIEMAQVIEIFPCERQGPVYPAKSISWLLMTWRRKEPGHHQPLYWPSSNSSTGRVNHLPLFSLDVFWRDTMVIYI